MKRLNGQRLLSSFYLAEIGHHRHGSCVATVIVEQRAALDHHPQCQNRLCAG